MADAKDRPSDIGFRGPRVAGNDGLHVSEVLAVVLGLIWVVCVGLFGFGGAFGGTEGGMGWIMTLFVMLFPLVLIGISVSTMRTVRSLRDEAGRLQSTVEALRNAYVTTQQAQATAGLKPSVEKRLDEIGAATRQIETVLAGFISRRETARLVPASDRKAALVPPAKPASIDEQPALALGTTVEDFRTPLSMADFIQALNFPESADDKDGFRALRLGLEDRTVARLIRAAQDMLTLLSEEGIYMDDLKPDHAPSDVWRQFAKGERGRAVAGLAGIRDRSSLALTAARMREDPVFRDAGHHFLRTFDRTFAAFEPNATDSEISDLAVTRTARAFMLIGRVTGTFD